MARQPFDSDKARPYTLTCGEKVGYHRAQRLLLWIILSGLDAQHEGQAEAADSVRGKRD